MITDLIFGLFFSVPGWLLSQLPTVAFPVSLTGTGSGSLYDTIHSGMTDLGSVNAWFPVGDAIVALGLVAACLVASLAIRLLRIVASFLTLGGGA